MKTMPLEIAKIRREICARCDAPCAAFTAGLVDHDLPSAACPRAWPSRWGCYGLCGDSSMRRPEYPPAPAGPELPGEAAPVPPAAPPAPSFGLGDAVATVAEPIARLSDALLGTKLVGCGSCAERRAALNRLVPDVTKPTP